MGARLTALTASLVLAACGGGTGGGGTAAERPTRTVTINLGGDGGERQVAARAKPDVAGLEDCENAQLAPTEGHEEAVEEAIVCLTNAERREHGLDALEREHLLAGPAERKASDMARRDYFEHVGPDGLDVVDWVRGTGYLEGAEGGYTLGENIGWAPEGSATPAQMVAAWMDSPRHRRNILSADFDDIGVGAVHGVPEKGANPGATYAQFFGSQTPPG